MRPDDCVSTSWWQGGFRGYGAGCPSFAFRTFAPRHLSREVAERASVNYGQIHHHFGAKDQLFAEALRRNADEFLAEEMDGGTREPVPIVVDRTDGLWRTQDSVRAQIFTTALVEAAVRISQVASGQIRLAVRH